MWSYKCSSRKMLFGQEASDPTLSVVVLVFWAVPDCLWQQLSIWAAACDKAIRMPPPR